MDFELELELRSCVSANLLLLCSALSVCCYYYYYYCAKGNGTRFDGLGGSCKNELYKTAALRSGG